MTTLLGTEAWSVFLFLFLFSPTLRAISSTNDKKKNAVLVRLSPLPPPLFALLLRTLTFLFSYFLFDSRCAFFLCCFCFFFIHHHHHRRPWREKRERLTTARKRKKSEREREREFPPFRERITPPPPSSVRIATTSTTHYYRMSGKKQQRNAGGASLHKITKTKREKRKRDFSLSSSEPRPCFSFLFLLRLGLPELDGCPGDHPRTPLHHTRHEHDFPVVSQRRRTRRGRGGGRRRGSVEFAGAEHPHLGPERLPGKDVRAHPALDGPDQGRVA